MSVKQMNEQQDIKSRDEDRDWKSDRTLETRGKICLGPPYRCTKTWLSDLNLPHYLPV